MVYVDCVLPLSSNEVDQTLLNGSTLINHILSHEVKDIGEYTKIDKWTDIDGWINRIDR